MKFRLIAWGSVAAICAILAGIWWDHSYPLRTAGIAGTDLKGRSAAGPKSVRSKKSPTISAPDLNALSEAVRHIMDPAVSDNERLLAFRALPEQLNAKDIEGLSAFLQRPEPQDANPLGQAVKNKIMDLLGELDAPEIPRLMMGIYQDKSRDEVVRDYALQHLVEYYERYASPGDGQVSKGEWREMAQVLWQAVTETDSSIAGTALLGLSRLSETQPALDRERVGALASQFASEETTAQFTRITAIQVSAQMKMREALPAIWQIAQSSIAPPLQISAIGALGVMGETNAIPFLNNILNGDAEYLKPAAKEALRQIARLEQQKARELEEEKARRIKQQQANNYSTTL
jgi:hypothetical protein